MQNETEKIIHIFKRNAEDSAEINNLLVRAIRTMENDQRNCKNMLFFVFMILSGVIVLISLRYEDRTRMIGLEDRMVERITAEIGNLEFNITD